MARYFHSLGLSAQVLAYISEEWDWLLTERVPGDDCVTAKYLEQPERLCDVLAEQLAHLHQTSSVGCPVHNHTQGYLRTAAQNYAQGAYDKDSFPDNWGYASPEEAWREVESGGHLLQNDTLIHGDYCLPIWTTGSSAATSTWVTAVSVTATSISFGRHGRWPST